MEGGSLFGQLGVAALHDGAGLDREILAARLARAAIAAGLLGRVMLVALAMRADRAVGPAGGFKPSPRCFLIMEARL